MEQSIAIIEISNLVLALIPVPLVLILIHHWSKGVGESLYGLSRFLFPRGISVFINEIYWVWLPLFVLMLGFRLKKRKGRGNE
jgi:hypothetical protein